VKFYLDENLSQKVAEICRRAGLDVVSSHEVGRNHLPDEEQLQLAAEDGRCFVTRDAGDLVDLTTLFSERRRPHMGLLIVPRSLHNGDFAGIARAIVAYASLQEHDMPSYMVAYLSAHGPR
jgi:predicted nuclease of predicted toxin-antitoxin system